MLRDAASGMLVGSALVLLLSRVLLALYRQRAISHARTAKYSDEARRRALALPGQAALEAAVDAGRRSIAELASSVPPRLAIALAMGAAGALVPFLVRKLSRSLMTDDSGPAGTLANALTVAGKWLVIGWVVQNARKWGVARLHGHRAAGQAAT
jgi:hypothetical protein